MNWIKKICLGLTFILVSFPAQAEIILSAPSIKAGMAEYHGNSGEVTMPDPVFRTKAYKAALPKAEKAGLDLNSVLNRTYAIYNEDDQIFFLFYNLAQAPNCKNEHLIQKVKVTKKNYNRIDSPAQEETTYLVEVMKLNDHKSIKRADEHLKRYGLKKYAKRSVEVECEIGCGFIPGLLTSDTWPYNKNKLYKRLQDYSTEPGLYDQVQFSDSRTYSFGFEFDENGRVDFDLPDYMKK